MAVSANDSKLLEQKDLISQLNATIAAQTELIQSLKKDHEADREQIQNLLAQVDYLTKKLFGTSRENERVCDECGAALEPIGKGFVRHEFRFTPAKGEVVNIYHETYKCPACSTADAMEENIKFVKAAVPEALIPNSYASGSAVAWVMYQKFANFEVN